jgi:mRNA-degrading endonuclease RelE of RelBE toxin-antitoxin system
VSYQVEFSRQGEKDLRRLDRTTLGRIKARINELAQDPLDSRLSRQMETDPETRYSRVGDWRIIYQAAAATQTIYIAAIRPRSRAYR